MKTSTKAKKQSYRIGSIVAIPMWDGRFAFARIYKASCFGVYDVVSSTVLPLEDIAANPILYFQASTDSAVVTGEWPVIGEHLFPDEDSAWPPPRATMYSKETNRWTMGGIPRVSYQGKVIEATLEQVEGLDIASVCNHPDQFIRILKDRLLDRNNDKYKVRPQ